MKKKSLIRITATAILGTAIMGNTAFATTVKVKPGDTLWEFSNKYNVSINDIKKANNLSKDIIYVGQVLNIPVVTQKPTNENETFSNMKEVSTRTKSPLNVRTGPSIGHRIVGQLKHGTKIEVIAYQNNWAKITFENTTAFVHGDYLKDVPNENPQPEPTEPEQQKPIEEVTIYTVKHGDYLYAIGKKFNVSYKDIVKWNNLTSNVIYTGQKLIVSKPNNTEVMPKPPEEEKEEEKEEFSVFTPIYYTVKSGDYLHKIATKYNISVEKIKKWNKLNSNIIYIGQKLKVSTSQFTHPSLGRYTSGFGERIHPITGKREHHNGQDIAKKGTVPIMVSADGVVSKSYLSKTYGEVVYVVHNIDGQTYETLYAHMKPGSRTVKPGDKVKQGELLGYMGNTGSSTAQHLHFELHEGRWNFDKTNAVDPLKYLE